MPSETIRAKGPHPVTAAAYAPLRGLGPWLERRRVQRAIARPVLLRLRRPIVSFTFDDFPKSAARTGASLIENIGGRATFYASAACAGRTMPVGPMFDAHDVKRLADHGHEIGCHTHARLNCARASADAVFADMVRNADGLAAMGMEARLVSFAYPFGETTAALKADLPQRFTSARGVTRGLASGRADLAHLRANAMYGVGALARCLGVLDAARRRSGWVIFFTHDVSPRPSPWGTPSGLLERLCGSAFAGGMRVLPVKEALQIALKESAD